MEGMASIPMNVEELLKHYPFLQDLYERVDDLEAEVSELKETLAHIQNDIEDESRRIL